VGEQMYGHSNRNKEVVWLEKTKPIVLASLNYI
jgi:hypothetical protein